MSRISLARTRLSHLSDVAGYKPWGWNRGSLGSASFLLSFPISRRRIRRRSSGEDKEAGTRKDEEMAKSPRNSEMVNLFRFRKEFHISIAVFESNVECQVGERRTKAKKAQ